VVISNCVINLSPDKERVFSEIFRVLKEGGELFFSDIFAGRRVPKVFQSDEVLLGECLAGAMYIEDFRRMLSKFGCLDYRIISRKPITIENPDIESKVGSIDFYKMTIRAFKLASLEDICEDYGHIAHYLGTIPDYPHRFPLDDHHTFITGKPMLVCGNTAAMVGGTRFGKHFKVEGDFSVHFGPFVCGPAAAKEHAGEASIGGACC
jgi:SAM-dependent methyltransferase